MYKRMKEIYTTRFQLNIQHKLFLNVPEQSLQYKHHMFALTMLHTQFVMSAGYQEVTVKIKRRRTIHITLRIFGHSLNFAV